MQSVKKEKVARHESTIFLVKTFLTVNRVDSMKTRATSPLDQVNIIICTIRTCTLDDFSNRNRSVQSCAVVKFVYIYVRSIVE